MGRADEIPKMWKRLSTFSWVLSHQITNVMWQVKISRPNEQLVINMLQTQFSRVKNQEVSTNKHDFSMLSPDIAQLSRAKILLVAHTFISRWVYK